MAQVLSKFYQNPQRPPDSLNSDNSIRLGR